MSPYCRINDFYVWKRLKHIFFKKTSSQQTDSGAIHDSRYRGSMSIIFLPIAFKYMYAPGRHFLRHVHSCFSSSPTYKLVKKCFSGKFENFVCGRGGFGSIFHQKVIVRQFQWYRRSRMITLINTDTWYVIILSYSRFLCRKTIKTCFF